MKLDTTNEDLLEELTHEWQYEIAVILKNTLKDNKIKGNKAKDIVGDFLFDLSMLYDQGVIKLHDKNHSPRLAFDDQNGCLISSKHSTNIHEFSYGNTDEAFKDEPPSGWFRK